ncbi:MAG TPA: helix-turn-helix domain-containing protein [Rhodanobacteraceae bacterium]|nr:helix-turn-helix domain-containing protein [Rhodanobacteraceae bacterium]
MSTMPENLTISPVPAVLPTHLDARPASHIDLDQLRQHVQVLRRRVEAGQYLYRSGQPFQALYLIRVGSVKTCELAEDGREQVTGFRMAGELLGVESIGLPSYACDVVALESSEIWELPYPPVLMACLRIPELQQSLTDAMAREIRRNRSWMLALGTLTAEQRVAAFLLDVASRYEALGFSGKHFILRMSRADMASYLALKHETVSRALSHLAETNCISVQRREMRIVDRDGMQRMAGFSARVH